MQNTGLAIAVGLSSHFLSIFGMVLMKSTHLRLGSNANHEIEWCKLFRSNEWGFGLLLLLVGGTLYPISLGLGPITLISALSLSAIPFNMLLSSWWLGDYPDEWVIASSLVVMGTLALGIAHSPSPGEWELHEDKELWRRPEFILYSLGLFGSLIGVTCINKCMCSALDSIYGYKILVAMVLKGVASGYIAILGKLAAASILEEDDIRTRIYVPSLLFCAWCRWSFPCGRTALPALT